MTIASSETQIVRSHIDISNLGDLRYTHTSKSLRSSFGIREGISFSYKRGLHTFKNKLAIWSPRLIRKGVSDYVISTAFTASQKSLSIPPAPTSIFLRASSEQEAILA